MSENKEQEPKKVLSLSGRPKLELKRSADATSQVRQSFSHGRSKAVTVEVKTQRVGRPPLTLPTAPVPEPVDQQARKPEAAPVVRTGAVPRQLTAEEREVRIRALKSAAHHTDDRRPVEQEALADELEIETEVAADIPAAPQPAVEVRTSLDPEARRQREMEELRRIDEIV